MRCVPTFLIIAGALFFIAPAEAKTIQVTVQNLSFSPQTIEANVGDVIEWNNKDPMKHTATVKGGWDTILPPKTITKQVLTAAEDVNYYCRYHPDMVGKLTVKP